MQRAVPAPALYSPTVTPPAGPLPLHRFLYRFVRNPLLALPQAVYEQPIVAYRTSRQSLVWITDPGFIERVLLHEHERFPKAPLERRIFGATLGDGILTSDGAHWRWQRRIAAPLFRHQDLLRLVPAMSEAAAVQITRWRSGAPASLQPVDEAMTDATYDVITRTLLAGCGIAEGEAIKRAARRMLDVISWEIAAALLHVPAWVWHPGKSRQRHHARILRRTVVGIIARRRAEGDDDAGLLGRLLAARDPDNGQPMSDEQIADNLLTFLLAGHETTAKALTWTLYLLARAPEWQARVRDEVRSVAGEGPLVAAHLDRLPITTRVLKEAMRLYPPAPVLTRQSVDAVEMGGYQLAAGTLVVIPIFALHRHRMHWPDPDRFDPDRFLPEREQGYLRTQYMPFGFGPRTCIGMSFAMIEATVLLATFVRGARFGWDGRHLPEPVSRVTLRPKGGMPLMVTCEE